MIPAHSIAYRVVVTLLALGALFNAFLVVALAVAAWEERPLRRRR